MQSHLLTNSSRGDLHSGFVAHMRAVAPTPPRAFPSPHGGLRAFHQKSTYPNAINFKVFTGFVAHMRAVAPHPIDPDPGTKPGTGSV